MIGNLDLTEMEHILLALKLKPLKLCKIMDPSICTVLLVRFAFETIQDFLIKLDNKPLMHLLEISIFSLNNDLVRLTKIMNDLVKHLKILSYKVIFQCLKLVKSFQKKIRIQIGKSYWDLETCRKS